MVHCVRYIGTFRRAREGNGREGTKKGQCWGLSAKYHKAGIFSFPIISVMMRKEANGI